MREFRCALRLARHQFRNAATHMLPAFGILSFAIGCVVAVRCIQVAATAKISGDSKAWLAADIAVVTDEIEDESLTAALNNLRDGGADHTISAELFTAIASSESPDATLAAIKVVDPSAYPYYGAVRLAPAAPLRSILVAESAVISADALRKLKIANGSAVRINGVPFRVAATLIDEPDRLAAAPNFYPRVMLSHEGLKRSRLAASGAPVHHRVLLRLPSSMRAQTVRAHLERALPATFVLDWSETDPQATRVVAASLTFLRVIGWFALAIAAVASAVAANAMVAARLDAIAITKALGGRVRALLAGYLIPLIAMSIVAVPAGWLLGAAIQSVALRLASLSLPIALSFHWEWRIAFQAAAAGVLTATASSALPLRRACRTPVLRVLRRGVEPMSGGAWQSMIAICSVLALTALSVIGSTVFALLMAAAVVASLGILAMSARILIAAGGRIARLGLLRPRANAPSMVVAIGAGIMILAAAGFSNDALQSAFIESLPIPGEGDLHLMALRRDSLDQIAAVLESHPAVIGKVQSMPLLLGLRLESAAPSEAHRLWGATCRDDAGGLTVSRQNAAEMGLKLGDIPEFRVKGKILREPVAQIRPVDNVANHRMGLLFPCRSFKDFDLAYEAGVRIAAGRQAEVRRLLAERFPWVPVLSRDQSVEIIQQALRSAVVFARLVSGVLIACGAFIMILLLAAERRSRMHEVAIWKALGAGSAAVTSALTKEMALLGIITGISGNAGGIALASAILSHTLARAMIVFDPLQALLIVVLSVAVAIATARLGMRRVLDATPLQVLRDE